MLPARTNSPRTLSRRGTWGPSRGRCGRSRRPSYEPFVTSLSLQLHVRDADLRERLAVAGVAAVTRAAGEAVDPGLPTPALPPPFDRHPCGPPHPPSLRALLCV